MNQSKAPDGPCLDGALASSQKYPGTAIAQFEAVFFFLAARVKGWRFRVRNGSSSARGCETRAKKIVPSDVDV